MELKIAQIQMSVTADREENIRRTCDMVRREYAGRVLRVIPLDQGRTDLVLREF